MITAELLQRAITETREHGEARCLRQRGGGEVGILEVHDSRIFGRMRDHKGLWWAIGWNSDGRWMDTIGESDLIPAPRSGEVRLWVNVYSDDASIMRAAYANKNAADRSACSSRLACVEVVVPWVEWQGLKEDGK